MIRQTRQREALAAAFGRSEDFRTAQELHEELRLQGTRIGLATVYRTLAAMVEAGDIDIMRIGDGEARYRRCETTTHHHHLVCRECGKAIDISGPGIERWTKLLAKQFGFVDIDHTLEVTGVCPQCHGSSDA